MKRSRMTATPRLAVVPPLTREQLAARAGERCERCACRLTLAHPSHAHHRQRRGNGDHGLGNLLWLCGACHADTHAHPAVSRTEGFIVSSFVTHPEQVPLLLHRSRWVLVGETYTDLSGGAA